MESTIKERLTPLMEEANIPDLDKYISLFIELKVPQNFVRACKNVGLEKVLTGSFYQIVGGKFERLYKQDAKTRQKVYGRLKEFGLSNNVIDEYFLKEAHISSPFITNIVGILPEDKKDKFVEVSQQIMLDYIREYLVLD